MALRPFLRAARILGVAAEMTTASNATPPILVECEADIYFDDVNPLLMKLRAEAYIVAQAAGVETATALGTWDLIRSTTDGGRGRFWTGQLAAPSNHPLAAGQSGVLRVRVTPSQDYIEYAPDGVTVVRSYPASSFAAAEAQVAFKRSA